ncbi:MAG: bifunctional pyr operon transcriptional regulator/uracil phosphoribosyltransferase PyrR [Bacteroidetes bacterium]|nr:MAG: bifunctional pyr operon transcriptional regulator/uracil phosphoribosyltransferase PyrR [Bacteroidota bacterium]
MSPGSRIILDSKQLNLSIERICYQLIENHNDFAQTVLVGLQPRGVFVAQRMHGLLEKMVGKNIQLGSLDITFNRDDHRRRDAPLIPSKTKMDFLVEGKHVIMIDDVLFTGRTIRAGMDALMAFGRPATIELVVLVDRRFSRQLPIEPNYIGARIDTIVSERVEVALTESGGNDTVKLYSPDSE